MYLHMTHTVAVSFDVGQREWSTMPLVTQFGIGCLTKTKNFGPSLWPGSLPACMCRKGSQCMRAGTRATWAVLLSAARECAPARGLGLHTMDVSAPVRAGGV